MAKKKAKKTKKTVSKKKTTKKKSGAVSADVEIVNQSGLHARAASVLVQLAATFEANIMISKGQNKANAKSIMGVMMLAAAIGSRLNVSAMGSDAAAAVNALVELVENKFGEDK